MGYFCSMRTKYFIEIDGVKSGIPKGCLRNWDEIQCACKRSDFNGVARSFTTQFQFVGEIYDKLMALYLRDGVNAHAVLSLYTITNEWEWVEQFSCGLDFSSISWDDLSLKINCIDNSLAAAIKAKKSTKYEFVVGQDIPVANTLYYDRISMQNSCAHEIMGHDVEGSNEVWIADTGPNPMRLSAYVIGDSEVYENSPLIFQDQTEEDGSCFIEVAKTTEDIEFETEIRLNVQHPSFETLRKFKIYLMAYDKENTKYNEESYRVIAELISADTDYEQSRTYLGLFPTFDALKKRYSIPPDNSWALVGEDYDSAKEAYVSTGGDNAEWVQTIAVNKTYFIGGHHVTTKICPLFICRKRITFHLATPGTCFAILYEHKSTAQWATHITSKITTRWRSKAKPIAIDALSPQRVLSSLMDKICECKINVIPSLKDTDERIAKTYLLAAESIRNIPDAKLYTSFNDFCDWMSTVFGYTYSLGEIKKAKFAHIQEYVMQFPLYNNHLHHTECPGGHGSQVIIIEGTPYFAVLGDDENDDRTFNYYTKWEGSEKYNDPVTGKARLDTVFYDEYYMGVYFDESYTLHNYPGDVTRASLDSQEIQFMPREELFSSEDVVKLANVRELSYTVNASLAYSDVTVGYEKQDYDKQCGRDEWNFSVQYTTGIAKGEKKLSLISKYRADCYGIEFLAQKRAEDTTDNKSDNNVFFAYCEEVVTTRTEGSGDTAETFTSSRLKIDRSGCTISGALASDVFNAQYAPYRCVMANLPFMAAACDPFVLTFASYEGNAGIVINGVKATDNFSAVSRLFTLGEIEFSSPDVDTQLDVNALYEVISNGVTYRGFIKEATFKYAKEQTVKYKLIVKEIVP